MLYNFGREHLQHKNGDAYGEHSKNHPQNNFVAKVNFPDCP